MKSKFTIIFLMLFFKICFSQDVIPLSDCKGNPLFVKKLTPPGMKVYLSTFEKYRIGFHLVELFPKNNNPPYRYSHPSWKLGGALGSFVIAPTGHVFVCPTPYINNYYNPPCEQNKLYRIHSQTGEMESVFQFYGDTSCTDFGLMGICYDCESDLLFVSSIKGSTKTKAKGKIYSLHFTRNDDYILIDSISEIDALGLSLAKIGGKKKLFFGDLRADGISSIEVSNDGHFISAPNLEINLNDERFMVNYEAKKIKFNQDNILKISLVPFDFSFSIPGHENESYLEYKYNKVGKNWILKKIELH
ncbi:MAG: hypothetical protein IPP01_10140 [Saprospiraceae bacterium]|nr:hypothetical protein [Saprospiraceae bacterium]MBK9994321.1 hypothetical protein [Saprospiraceae bacterium]